jgi:Na+-driven multidrug efflux pump
MGIAGAGTALATSAWVSAIVYVAYIGRTPLGRLSPFRLPHLDWSLRILRVALPTALQAMLRVFSMAAFTMVLKQVNEASAAIAATGFAFAIESIMFMPAFGLSAATAALVGQSLGMRRPERAQRLAWTAGHYGALVTICLAAPIFIFAPVIAMGMTGGKADIAYQTTNLLRCLCLTEFLFAYAMVMIGAMQGAGDTVRPLWIAIIALWGLRVPLTLAFALPVGFRLYGLFPLPVGLNLGADGAWIAITSTQGLQGIMAIAAFKQGHWKTEKV